MYRRECADLDRRFELEQDGLRDEDFSRLGAQIADLRLQQLHLLAGPAAPDLEEPVYDRVQVYLVFGHSCGLLRALVGVLREQGRASRGWEEATVDRRGYPLWGLVSMLLCGRGCWKAASWLPRRGHERLAQGSCKAPTARQPGQSRRDIPLFSIGRPGRGAAGRRLSQSAEWLKAPQSCLAAVLGSRDGCCGGGCDGQLSTVGAMYLCGLRGGQAGREALLWPEAFEWDAGPCFTACCGGASLRETSGTETTDELLTAAE
jgi:hypothetical protein